MTKLLQALAGVALLVSLALLAPGAAQQPAACNLGQNVLDDAGNPAVVVGEHDASCLVKYADGRTQTWIAATRLRPAAGKPAVPANDTAALGAAGGVAVLRPSFVNRLAYPADALGHVVLTAEINDMPVRFLVDTGATLVSLTPHDAEAAGITRSELTFDHTVTTGNGPVPAAFVTLREIRIDQLAVDNVPAAVIDSLKQSVLGMSFLGRLKGFGLHHGVLTMTW